MAISVTTANDVLQNDYLPGFQSQVNEAMSWFYKAIEKTQKTTSGDKFVWHARYGRSGGVGSRAESADLPTPRARNRDNVESTAKNFYARLQITDKLMKASNGAAFVEELGQQMEELMTDSKNDLNRQIFGDSTGTLGLVDAIATAATSFSVAAAKFIDVGMSIDIYNTTLATEKYDNLEVTNVDKIAGTVTTATSVTLVVGDVVILHDALNAEITGLALIMDTDNEIYNLDRADNAWFNPNVYTLSGNTDLDDDYAEYGFQLLDEMSGEKPDQLMAGYSAFRNFKNYLSQFQRYTETASHYAAGHTVMHYNGVPVEQDKYQEDQTLDYLTLPHFELRHIGENFAWLDNDGAILSRVANKPAYEATLVLYAELCNKFPKAQFRYKQIQKTTFTPAS